MARNKEKAAEVQVVEGQVEGAEVAQVEGAAPVVEAPKLTRTEKLLKRIDLLKKRIETDTAEYQEIANELNSAEALSKIGVGSVVTIKLGRKFADRDTTRHVDGVIIGIREDDDGAVQYKVQHGTGFDADIAVVGAGAIVGVPTVETEATAA